MRKLIGFGLIGLVGLWVVAEVAIIPAYAAREVERQVEARTGDVASVEADLDSFPLATRLMLTGRINRATITLDRAVRQNITYATVRFELDGIQMDRNSLFSDPRVTAIDEGRIEAVIDLSTLSPLLGRASAVLGEQVRIEGGRFFVGRFSAEIARDLIPCDPDGRVEGTNAILTCTIHDVPEVLLKEAQR